MSVSVSLPRRHRSSTGASKTLKTGSRESRTTDLVRRLVELSDGKDAENLDAAIPFINELWRELDKSDSSKDAFRNGQGFEAILQLFHRVPKSTDNSFVLYCRVLKRVLILLSAAVKDHRGNNKYFRFHLDGWKALQRALSELNSLESQAGFSAKTRAASVLIFQGLFACAICDDSLESSQEPTKDVGGDESLEELCVISGNEVLHNPEACAIAIRLSVQLVQDTTSKHDEALSTSLLVLQMATAIVELSTRNKVALWKTSVLSDILPVLLGAQPDSQAENSLSRLHSALSLLGLSSLNDVAW